MTGTFKYVFLPLNKSRQSQWHQGMMKKHWLVVDTSKTGAATTRSAFHHRENETLSNSIINITSAHINTGVTNIENPFSWPSSALQVFNVHLHGTGWPGQAICASLWALRRNRRFAVFVPRTPPTTSSSSPTSGIDSRN